MLSTVNNATKILDLFDQSHPEWGVAEISDALAVSRPSAHALLATLTHGGLLQRTARSRYRLGWRLFALGHVLIGTTEYSSESRRALDELVLRFGELAHIGVLDDTNVVYVAVVPGTKSVQAAVPRIVFPAHCTAAGKVLLAFQPWPEVETRLRAQEPLVAMTARTVTALEALWEELRGVRERGYARCVGESVEELSSIAAPIKDHGGTVLAAIGIVVPDYRFHERESDYLAGVMDAAQSVSLGLGYRTGIGPEPKGCGSGQGGRAAQAASAYA